MQVITTRDIDIWRRRGNNWRKEGRRVKKGTTLSGEFGLIYFYLNPDQRTKRAWVKAVSVVTPPPVTPPAITGAYFAWDDQNPDYNNKCRTQMPDYHGPDNPPAVLRFYPEPIDRMGDFRVDISAWKQFFLNLNGGSEHKFDYWTGPETSQFNQTGWAKLAYLGMSGNAIKVLELTPAWVKFETLKASEIPAWSMTDPCFIHSFHCVTWDRETKTTKRILSTGAPIGTILYPLVTKEGYAWIPRRHVAGL